MSPGLQLLPPLRTLTGWLLAALRSSSDCWLNIPAPHYMGISIEQLTPCNFFHLEWTRKRWREGELDRIHNIVTHSQKWLLITFTVFFHRSKSLEPVYTQDEGIALGQAWIPSGRIIGSIVKVVYHTNLFYVINTMWRRYLSTAGKA